MRPILALTLILQPALSHGQHCGSRVCVKPVVAVPVVATPVQTIVQIPTYSVSYDAGTASIIAELQAIREELRLARTGQAVAAPTLASLTATSCASCHSAKVAAVKAKPKKGKAFVMVDEHGTGPFSLPEKRRIRELIERDQMPPGRPLSPAEKSAWQKVLDADED